MLKWLLALSIFVCGLWALAMSFTHSYKECQANRGTEYVQPYKPAGDEKVETFLLCQGVSLDANGELLTAIGTLFIAFFTWTLWESTERSGEHFRVTERAYVKLSQTPPGAMFTIDLAHNTVVVQIQVKNFGHTPAYVTDVYLDVQVLEEDAPLPAVPEYPPIDGRVPIEGFLVAEDHFHHTVVMGMTNAQWTLAQAGGRLIILGYVDYRDKFGYTHGGAYAREYDSQLDDRTLYESDKAYEERNNMPIVTQARYNDDFVIAEA